MWASFRSAETPIYALRKAKTSKTERCHQRKPLKTPEGSSHHGLEEVTEVRRHLSHGVRESTPPNRSENCWRCTLVSSLLSSISPYFSTFEFRSSCFLGWVGWIQKTVYCWLGSSLPENNVSILSLSRNTKKTFFFFRPLRLVSIHPLVTLCNNKNSTVIPMSNYQTTNIIQIIQRVQTIVCFC